MLAVVKDCYHSAGPGFWSCWVSSARTLLENVKAFLGPVARFGPMVGFGPVTDGRFEEAPIPMMRFGPAFFVPDFSCLAALLFLAR